MIHFCIKIPKFVFLLVISFYTATGHADTIFFKNGMRLDVEEVWEESGQIKCSMYGAEYSYVKEEIDRIERERGKSSENNDSLPLNSENTESDVTSRSELSESLRYHKEALSLVEEGKWPAAIEMEKKAYDTALDKKSAGEALSAFYNQYAVIFQKKGQYQESLQQLEHALTYVPDSEKALGNTAIVYLIMAHKEYNKRKYGAARVLLTKALSYDLENPNIYLLSGKIAYNGNDYNDAKNAWQKALRLNPELEEARFLLLKLDKERNIEGKLKEYESGDFVIKFRCVRNVALADKTIKVLKKAYIDVGADLDTYPNEKISVIIYPKGDINELGYFPDWAAGQYDGKIRFPENLAQRGEFFKVVLYHEYTHAIVHMKGGRGIPLWLNEGLAEYEAGRCKSNSMRDSSKKLLLSAKNQNALIPVTTLSRMNGFSLSRLSPEMRRLVYVQSESFVAYLIKRYSLFDVKSVVIAIGKGKPALETITKIFNNDINVLYQAWRDQL